MRARKLYAHGEQRDYFDKRNCIGKSSPTSSSSLADNLEGFVRNGNLYHPHGLACIISNGAASYKRMYVGKKHCGEEWTDILEWCVGTVIIDRRGYGIFPVSAKSASVWVSVNAGGRKDIDRPL